MYSCRINILTAYISANYENGKEKPTKLDIEAELF